MTDIKIYTGENILPYIDFIAQLRIVTFKEFPYLYQGNLEYEKKYLSGYSSTENSMIAIAWIDNKIAGISTGIPLISDSDIVAGAKDLFIKHQINPENYYYYGETIILPKYRGLGLSKKIFSAQDKKAKDLGFHYACMMTVIREMNHPLIPSDYKSPEPLWRKLGFAKNGLKATFNWPTICSDSSINDMPNDLEFWVKDISI